MKRILAALFLTATILTVGMAAANANAQPPTNGGNGAGQSGQCTGPADERPASCQSSK
jgi:Spy/CpxP family protein refolding chaperone